MKQLLRFIQRSLRFPRCEAQSQNEDSLLAEVRSSAGKVWIILSCHACHHDFYLHSSESGPDTFGMWDTRQDAFFRDSASTMEACSTLTLGGSKVKVMTVMGTISDRTGPCTV